MKRQGLSPAPLGSPQRYRRASSQDTPPPHELLRNVYKVLATRGMVGTVITSVDPETQQMLEGLVGPVRGSADRRGVVVPAQA